VSNGCRWVAAHQTRIVPRRHIDTCPDPDTCPGCLPCPEKHCGICRRAHSDVTCTECIATVRQDLDLIRDMCGLPLVTEGINRGIHSEAFMLTGPTANPEAWSNQARSAILGRIPAAYLEDCRDEQHPLWVLGTWEQLWRDHLDQPTDLMQTLDRASYYLERHLHELAQVEDPNFAEFATEIRDCRTHLQAVLRDQNQGDRANIGCFDCGGQLERRLTKTGFEDQWTCTRCRRRYTYAEYNFALRASLEEATEQDAS
jgi:hypothetical protein